MQTQVPFTLPIGIDGDNGERHRQGVMRLARARDEIQPLGDTEVRRNEAYLSVLLVARTLVSVGPVTEITPAFVEDLYAADFDHLQRLYERINTANDAVAHVACPTCREAFDVDLVELQDGPAGR